MKRILTPFACLALVYAVSSCLDPSVQTPNPTGSAKQDARDDAPLRSCATMDVLEENMKDDPQLAKKIKDINDHAKRFADQQEAGRASTAAVASVPYDGTVTIPVIVHVIYNTAQEKITTDQIASQIRVLNNDYRKTNSDINKTPAVFASLESDMNIQFSLSSVDYKSSNKTSWGTRDAMKSTKKGGVDPVQPSKYLNIWVCNIGGGILGYAQFPGGSAATDGVVIGPQFFGSSDYVTGGYLQAPYDKGRTATHEIGHWLNLRHIWGDANCGDDLVSDTPKQQTSNYGCPGFPHVTCTNGPNGDLFVNYMDYTDDPCMVMFSNGQKTRSRALFASDGARRSFVTL